MIRFMFILTVLLSALCSAEIPVPLYLESGKFVADGSYIGRGDQGLVSKVEPIMVGDEVDAVVLTYDKSVKRNILVNLCKTRYGLNEILPNDKSEPTNLMVNDLGSVFVEIIETQLVSMMDLSSKRVLVKMKVYGPKVDIRLDVKRELVAYYAGYRLDLIPEDRRHEVDGMLKPLVESLPKELPLDAYRRMEMVRYEADRFYFGASYQPNNVNDLYTASVLARLLATGIYGPETELKIYSVMSTHAFEHKKLNAMRLMRCAQMVMESNAVNRGIEGETPHERYFKPKL